MRIGLLAPVGLPVPPEGYGGTELVVSQLAEGLVARGHEVTLFASGDSRTAAQLSSLYPHALEGLGVCDKRSYAPYEVAHVARAFAIARAREFDVLHDHTKVHGILAAQFSPTPVLTTIHNDFTPERRQVYAAFPRHPYVAISHAHARAMPELAYAGVVYNGLELASTRFSAEKEDYLLFLGRLDAAKGADWAARIARALGWPLVMAGRVGDAERDFFVSRVAPHLDGVKRRYVGEVSGEPKWKLYAGARALLFPIQWPEPFGLVMIEAMACGTPVVGVSLGSVPEVVEDGVTGRLVAPERATDLDALVEATRAAVGLDPAACRARVERHFSASAMVTGYEALYRRLVDGA